MVRFFYILFGIILTAFGALIFLSPMPLGFLFLLPGLALLVTGSDHVARWFMRRRARNAELNQKITDLEDKAPGPISKPLRETDPAG